MDSAWVYIARLKETGRVRQVIEFEAPDPTTAWIDGNDGIDPLSGHWVEVQPGLLHPFPFEKVKVNGC